MPVLSNPKHELFAQALSKGKTQTDAYEEAGYRPSRSAASRLAEDVNICARVRELQEKVAAKTEVTVAGITERLLAIATKAETGDGAASLGVASTTLMHVAKLNGLVVDKQEVTGLIGRMTPEQRAARTAELLAKRGT